MADFNAQNTDQENAKAAPKSVARDEMLSKSAAGSAQKIAREPMEKADQKANAVTATRK